MPRRLLTSLLTVLFVASSSGLALAVHLHHEGPDHDLGHCAIHQALVAGGHAVIDAPAASIEAPTPTEAAQPDRQAVPVIRIASEPIAPRAPPHPF